MKNIIGMSVGCLMTVAAVFTGTIYFSSDVTFADHSVRGHVTNESKPLFAHGELGSAIGHHEDSSAPMRLHKPIPSSAGHMEGSSGRHGELTSHGEFTSAPE